MKARSLVAAALAAAALIAGCSVGGGAGGGGSTPATNPGAGVGQVFPAVTSANSVANQVNAHNQQTEDQVDSGTP